VSSKDWLSRYLTENRNWGRWGPDDQVGALNLIDDAKRRSALGQARTGQVLSLSRPLATRGGAANPAPAQHFMHRQAHGLGGAAPADDSDDLGGGYAADYYGVYYHGLVTTHLDALCHVWGTDGMWGGVSGDSVTFRGASFAGIENWATGICTRGVLLDVPRYRETEFVDFDTPVTGAELEDIVRQQGIALEPGDAVCVYSGREAWQAAHPDEGYGRRPFSNERGLGFARPGLDPSCVPFFREHDVSVLVWDMVDAVPFDLSIIWSVHSVIWAFGVAVVDNAVLDKLADACSEQSRTEFLLVVAPLVVNGGTGSPVNPLAVL
jgi:hypothetical protein